ncbi:uncharacterized protein LOC128555606 [Mercenaria mercenaria]|uniref:uncharacterized protein LOC128555606 n=1 Tax=Mercenaria mercenaria TaxID=6596 RepID=UPI00234EBBEA|nr:uncharacterized protein LOC128555606 [Mercenaria mercenaria]
MSQFKGVFLLEITEEDDVSDLKKLMTKSFQMKENYYLQNILIVFECKHEDPKRLRALYETVNTSNLSQSTFIIITSIDRSRVAALELNAEQTLIADGIDSVIVSSIDIDSTTSDDEDELSRQFNQLVAKRKGSLWEKYPIKNVCLENLKHSGVIRLPDEIRSIHLRDCDPTIHLVHNATILDVSCQNPLFYDTFNPITIFSSTLTIVSLGFSANSHIFNRSLYKKFANGLSQNAQISSLLLRNMKVGKKVFTVKLEKQEIEQMKISMKTNEDYRRHGARILGPKLEIQTFDREDFNAELERHDSFAAYVILDLICYDLVKTHNAISESYPAKQNNTNEIYLVCFMKRYIDMDSFKGFSLVKRDYCFVSKESLKAENSFNRDEPSFLKTADKEFIAINETVSYHADHLMDTHKNLEAVKVSFVRSSKGQFEHPHPCIVLYCKVKGYIPFGEKCFPKQLAHPFIDKSYETDIREGFFTPCPYLTSRSTEWNKELAFGCSVGEMNTNIAATLGPLVNIKETGETCFLTVRHLFQPLPPLRNDSQIVGVKVVQPADIHLPPRSGVMQDRLCGEVLSSHIGGQIDAALVKICQERIPSRGHFVNITKEDLNFAGLSLTDLPTYDDGDYMDAKTLTVQNNATRRIIKIGNVTSLTKGTLSTTDGVVRETMEYTTLETLYNGSRQKYVVKNQLLVDSYVNKIFCQAGDSGSAVFLADDDNRLYCIGMVIGMLANDCSAVVTPIMNILDILGHKLGKTLELKKFEFDQMDEQ